MSDTFTLGLVQMECSADSAANLEKATASIREAGKRGAQIVCLPELFLTPYFCKSHDINLFDLAEPIPGPRTDRLARAAKEAGVVVVASLFERKMAGLFFNTATVFDADGTLLGIYRKMHIPHDPLYFEKYFFRPGDLGFRVFPTKFGNVGTLVCWDQWFPEGVRADRPARSRGFTLSHGDRLAPAREGRVRQVATRCLGDDPARARHRQRRLCRRDQPGWLRTVDLRAAWSFGAHCSPAIRSALCLHAPVTPMKRSSSSPAIGAGWKTFGELALFPRSADRCLWRSDRCDAGIGATCQTRVVGPLASSKPSA